jgi:exopolysaccharide biosynthesis polyprenyl glycosylphosphotransferase
MDSKKSLIKRLELLADVLFSVLSFYCAFLLKLHLPENILGGLSSTPNYDLVAILITVIWYITFDFLQYPLDYGAPINRKVFTVLVKTVAICSFVLVAFLFIFKAGDISRLLIGLFAALNVIFLLFARWLTRLYIIATRKNLYFYRNILILGSFSTAKDLIQLILDHPEANIHVVGCIEIDRKEVGKKVYNGISVIGTLDDLRDILLNQVIDEVLITMPLNEIDNSEWYLSFINTFGIIVRIIPYWYIRKYMSLHPNHYSVQIQHFLSEPALVLRTVPIKQDAMLVKTIFDVAIAVTALILSSPLFLILPLFIKVISPGPVFYKQTRSGQFGRKFPLFKFRTMSVDAEKLQESLMDFNEAKGPVFKMKNDPRIIPYIGSFLRKTGLDEIPQFINVLRGEMSVVGPRPPIPSEVERYELWQRRRLSMKPGITGIWQTQWNRNDISFEQWMNMDLDYIDRWSIWLDIYLILKTFPIILLRQGR